MGLLLVKFQQEHEVSATIVSVVYGVQAFTYCIVTVVVMNNINVRLTVRTSTTIGILIGSLGVAISGLLPSNVSLVITQGVLFGFGHGMLYCPTLCILSVYFDRRRPLATAIASCGSSLGGILFPLLTQVLVNFYGLTGALLLLSAFLLQQLVFVSLFTPPSHYKPPRSLTNSEHTLDNDDDSSSFKLIDGKSNGLLNECGDSNFKEKNDIEDNNGYKQVVPQNHLLFAKNRIKELNPQSNGTNVLFSSDSRLNRRNVLNDESSSSIYRALSLKKVGLYYDDKYSTPVNGDSRLGSRPYYYMVQDIQSHPDFMQLLQKSPEEKEQEELESNYFPKDLPDDIEIAGEDDRRFFPFFVPPVMRRKSFWILSAFFVGGAVGTGLPALFLPPMVREKNRSDEEGALFLMVSSFVGIFGRLIPGVILHFGILKPSQLMVIPLTICGVFYCLVTVMNSFRSLLALAVVYGVFSASFWVLQTLVVIEVLGLDLLPPAIGYYAIVMGCSSAGGSPIGGALHDLTGSYSSTFAYFGANYFFAALALIVIQVVGWKNRKQEAKD